MNAAVPNIVWQELDGATPGSSSGLYGQWISLFENDTRARITEHPDFVLIESDGQAVTLVCAYVDKQLSAAAVLLPKQSNTRQAGAFGPAWKLQGYRLVGNRILGDPSTSLQQAIIRQLTARLKQSHGDFLLIEEIEPRTALWNALQDNSSAGNRLFSPTGMQPWLRIKLPDTVEDYWAKFSSKARYNQKRQRKQLEKQGRVRLQKTSNISDVSDYLKYAYTISLNTWQTRQFGLRIKNDEKELRLTTFLANQGALRSYLLFLDEKPIAFVAGNQHNGTFHYEEVGYDSEFAKFSPGQVLLSMVINEMYADKKPDWFDFGLGDASYKRLMSNHQSESGSIWLVPTGLKMTAIITVVNVSRYLRNKVRGILKSTGGFTLLRRRLRGKN